MGVIPECHSSGSAWTKKTTKKLYKEVDKLPSKILIRRLQPAGQWYRSTKETA